MSQTSKTPSKLVKLREWLELPDAAKYLSAVWGENVTEADVLRLGLEGVLTISIHLVNQGKGRAADIIPVESVQWKELPHLFESNVMMRIPDSEIFSDTHAMRLRDTERAEILEGVFDLPMIGAEQLVIEHAYQELTGGPSVELIQLAGCFVQRDGRTYQLLERFRDYEFKYGVDSMLLKWFFPAQDFPAGTAVVIRTAALRELESDSGVTALWPWGEHSTRLLNNLADAARTFWQLYDPADPSTAPTNEQVVDFLRKRGVALRTAEVMATILRADGLPTGPRK